MQHSDTIRPAPAVNPRWRELNAFTYLDPGFDPLAAGLMSASGAVAQGSRPPAGYSLAIKDNIEVAGMPCTCGTPALRTYVPKIDAPAIARLRSAGAGIVGKTNMHELAYGITSNNAAFGPVRNAFDPLCFAGGSSAYLAYTKVNFFFDPLRKEPRFQAIERALKFPDGE
jgi:Asp-tRNA(Asn)/Glu-tRNA(Gln) amidotransferase A subunit family amidase